MRAFTTGATTNVIWGSLCETARKMCFVLSSHMFFIFDKHGFSFTEWTQPNINTLNKRETMYI